MPLLLMTVIVLDIGTKKMEERSKTSILIVDHFSLTFQCWTQSMFGDTIYLCYCKFRLVPLPSPPWWGLRGWKFLILITVDCWKRHFLEQNYIENYFYLLKSTKSFQATFQKCLRNIIWADFFGCSYRSNGI